MKTPFVTCEQLESLTQEFPPLSISMMKQEFVKRLVLSIKLLLWNEGFKEYFAIKATPNPSILKILQEEGCGVDTASYVELLMADKLGFSGKEIMFSSQQYASR